MLKLILLVTDWIKPAGEIIVVDVGELVTARVALDVILPTINWLANPAMETLATLAWLAETIEEA